MFPIKSVYISSLSFLVFNLAAPCPPTIASSYFYSDFYTSITSAKISLSSPILIFKLLITEFLSFGKLYSISIGEPSLTFSKDYSLGCDVFKKLCWIDIYEIDSKILVLIWIFSKGIIQTSAKFYASTSWIPEYWSKFEVSTFFH